MLGKPEAPDRIPKCRERRHELIPVGAVGACGVTTCAPRPWVVRWLNACERLDPAPDPPAETGRRVDMAAGKVGARRVLAIFHAMSK